MSVHGDQVGDVNNVIITVGISLNVFLAGNSNGRRDGQQ